MRRPVTPHCPFRATPAIFRVISVREVWIVCNRMTNPNAVLTHTSSSLPFYRSYLPASRLESTGALVPGVEVDLMARKEIAPLLQCTKTVLLDWAERHNTLLFDAGRSEQFGCVASEFVDAMHAVPECYRKVLGALW